MARVRRDIDSRFRDMSQRELTDYIHKMGKVANTRLRELEKTKHGAIYKQSFDTWKADHQEQGDISFSEWSEIFSEGIIRNFLDQYGSEKFHELTQKSRDYKMSSEELANVLYSAGFREDTDFYKRENPDRMISIEHIYDELEKVRKGQR